MIQEFDQLRITMLQMERLLAALEDLREQVLPKDAALFAAMAEGPLDDLQRLRGEVNDYLRDLQPAS
jgi:ribosomal 50S subunit-associated protein YjgA (DUF615 family)